MRVSCGLKSWSSFTPFLIPIFNETYYFLISIIYLPRCLIALGPSTTASGPIAWFFLYFFLKHCSPSTTVLPRYYHFSECILHLSVSSLEANFIELSLGVQIDDIQKHVESKFGYRFNLCRLALRCCSASFVL